MRYCQESNLKNCTQNDRMFALQHIPTSLHISAPWLCFSGSLLTWAAVLATDLSSLFGNGFSEYKIKRSTTYQDGSCRSLRRAGTFALSLMFVLFNAWFIFIRVACNHVLCSSVIIILELKDIPFKVLWSFVFFAPDSSTPLSLSMMLASFSFSARLLFDARW